MREWSHGSEMAIFSLFISNQVFFAQGVFTIGGKTVICEFTRPVFITDTVVAASCQIIASAGCYAEIRLRRALLYASARPRFTLRHRHRTAMLSVDTIIILKYCQYPVVNML